jgi:DNA invertase Pin-like site-specific DNA recombinase
MSDKIKPHHQARKAILYIRQSSIHQVHHNLESQRLQYAMQDRLQQLGWREVDVVDDDLGRSAAGLVTRAGFARMVADVCLGQVGAVAARRCRASPAIAGSGSNWSKSVVSWIPC